MNILIVNDIQLEAVTLQKTLHWEEMGVSKAFTAFSADEAKEIIQKEEIDILLSDIEMPGDNGIALIRWIQEQHYDIDVILLTCHADFAYARDGLTLGCQDYILMPASYESIAASVQKTILRRRERLENERMQTYGRNWLSSQAETASANEPAHRRTSKEIAEECEKYVLNHLASEELSVTEIASSLYLDPIHLNRIFKKERGQNLSQYITQERMELAALLIRTTDHSAYDIAVSCGYPNYPYFSTVFKKYFGMPPSQYLQENRNSENSKSTEQV